MSLGEMYIEQGDYEKGKEYLRRAGEKGNQSALETLKKIEAVQEKKQNRRQCQENHLSFLREKKCLEGKVLPRLHCSDFVLTCKKI
ncbi:hypothetical protein A8O28_14930 [Enterobacteriaceae bacterium CCUG 67584]|nr:hypothetical protein [Enterobacteriaceae bacterium CCUG 67584]